MGLFSETKEINGKNAIKNKYHTEITVGSVEMTTKYRENKYAIVDIEYKIIDLVNQSLHPSGDIKIEVYIESLEEYEIFFSITDKFEQLNGKTNYSGFKIEKPCGTLPKTGDYNLFITVSEYTTSSRYVERCHKNCGTIYFKHPRDIKAENIAKKIFDNHGSRQIDTEDESFYEKNRALVDNKLKELKNKYNDELEKQKQEEEKRIQEELKKKELEREEEARENAFQKNLKSISEDIDALELAVGKGVFNIQQLSLLEDHISILCENKSILNENNRNILQRKMKYLKVIFQDCEKLPDCKGSAKIRMGEILKMLDGLNKS